MTCNAAVTLALNTIGDKFKFIADKNLDTKIYSTELGTDGLNQFTNSDGTNCPLQLELVESGSVLGSTPVPLTETNKKIFEIDFNTNKISINQKEYNGGTITIKLRAYTKKVTDPSEIHQEITLSEMPTYTTEVGICKMKADTKVVSTNLDKVTNKDLDEAACKVVCDAATTCTAY